MKKFFALALLVLGGVLLFQGLSPSVVEAQRPTPPNQRAIGLVYDGLEPDNARPGLYRVKPARANQKVHYTHGPDAAPSGVNLALAVAPISSTTPALAGGAILCNGDGVSGKRVQVLYVRAADVPDQFDLYRASFERWAADADAEFYLSGIATGESRHVRFVTDANCNLAIERVVLSPTGDDFFNYTIGELQSLGYNRTDRKYLIFMDAHVYCGIATIEPDDQPGPNNINNSGPSYGRIDSGCWSGVIAAHELMHNLGGVQLSAPHTDGGWHCTDGYDNMCDHSGHSIHFVCPDPAGDHLMDCNYDDYFNANPPNNSYLATRWNTANSPFLIAPNSAHVSAIATGKAKGSRLDPDNTFRAGSQVAIQIHLVDQLGANLSGATVNVTVLQSDGKVGCTLAGTTDSAGNVIVNCRTNNKAPTGTWTVRVDQVTKAGYLYRAVPPPTATFTIN